MTDKERFATIGTWVEVFREEGTTVCYATIRNKLKEAGIKGCTAREYGGRLLIESYYAESRVRQVLSDLLRGLPQAGEDGSFTISNERFATVEFFESLLGLSRRQLQRVLEDSNAVSVEGRDRGGKICQFYCESDTRNACSDYLGTFPQSDKCGILVFKGERYGTIRSLAKLIGVSESIVKHRVESASLRPIKGKNIQGAIYYFYRESDVRHLCGEHLEGMPITDKGMFLHQGQSYGTMMDLAELFGLSAPTILTLVRNASIEPIKAKRRGNIYDCYPESKVRQVLGKHNQKYERECERGVVVKDGIRYVVLAGFARFIGVTGKVVYRRLRACPVESIKVKSKGGQIRDFYRESKLLELFADYSRDFPRADEDGYLVLNGKRYGTPRSLYVEFGVTDITIKKRCRASGVKPIKGKSVRGLIYDYYSVDRVRELCADLIAKKSKK